MWSYMCLLGILSHKKDANAPVRVLKKITFQLVLHQLKQSPFPTFQSLEKTLSEDRSKDLFLLDFPSQLISIEDVQHLTSSESASIKPEPIPFKLTTLIK